jgi:hypothetical protein
MATIKKMKKAQSGYDSAIKSAASKPMTPKLGYTPDKKAESKIPSLDKKIISDQLKKYNDSSVVKSTKKYKSGGSLTGLKAGTKRVGPVDPKGAYTKVQKKTLAGAKGKASLVKDKQLGATKMKSGGKMGKCKYGCH